MIDLDRLAALCDAATRFAGSKPAYLNRFPVAEVRQLIDAYKERTALLAERDAARADAERYRYLHNTAPYDTDVLCVVNKAILADMGLECLAGNILDAAIDAAIRPKPQPNSVETD